MSIITNAYILLVIVTIISNSLSTARVIIERYDECYLPDNLKKEIESYKNVTAKIMDEIKNNGYGDRMYKQYSDFIDKFGARPSGTDTLERAIDHMLNLTKEAGVSEVYSEEVEVPHWKRIFESATLSQPYEKNIAILGLGTSISTPQEGITAEVVVVDSFDTLDKTDSKQVKGKIVVFNPKYVSYGVTVPYRTLGATKASMKGAVASLIRSVTPFSIYSPHTGAQYYSDNVTKIPTASITVEDADLLGRLQEKGDKIVIKLIMLNSYSTTKSSNTLVDIKGKEYPDKQVIVSGHIDSWDVGQGAMDDGGGMMISWFVPVALNYLKLKPRRTVRAILWTAEEPGIIGGQAYVKKHMNELSNIDIAFESDEGTFKPQGLVVSGSKETICIIKEILKLFSPIDKLVENNEPGSDITVFEKYGIPAASLMNENDRYYWFHHSEGDTMDVQNKDDVVSCAAFWAAVSYIIADLSIDLPRN